MAQNMAARHDDEGELEVATDEVVDPDEEIENWDDWGDVKFSEKRLLSDAALDNLKRAGQESRFPLEEVLRRFNSGRGFCFRSFMQITKT